MRNVLVGLMVVGLTACGSSLGTSSGSGGRGGQSASGTAGAMGGASFVGGGGVVGGGGTGGAAVSSVASGTGGYVGTPLTCVPGIPATTQLRRMRNRQYDAVVRDLLGVTTRRSPAAARSRRRRCCTPTSTARWSPTPWRLYQGRRRGDREGGHGQPDPEGEVHQLRPGGVGLPDDDHQDLRPQGVPPPADRRRGDALRGAWPGTPTGTPDDVAEATLLAFLLSPSFLMLPEMTTTPGSAAAEHPALQLRGRGETLLPDLGLRSG